MKLVKDSSSIGRDIPSAALTSFQLLKENPYDFPKGDTGNGKIMAAQIGTGITDGDRHHCGNDSTGNKSDPGIDMESNHQKGRGVGPDAEEGRLTEGEHSGITAHDIPGHAQHAKHEYKNHDMRWI